MFPLYSSLVINLSRNLVAISFSCSKLIVYDIKKNSAFFEYSNSRIGTKLTARPRIFDGLLSYDSPQGWSVNGKNFYSGDHIAITKNYKDKKQNTDGQASLSVMSVQNA